MKEKGRRGEVRRRVEGEVARVGEKIREYKE